MNENLEWEVGKGRDTRRSRERDGACNPNLQMLDELSTNICETFDVTRRANRKSDVVWEAGKFDFARYRDAARRFHVRSCKAEAETRVTEDNVCTANKAKVSWEKDFRERELPGSLQQVHARIPRRNSDLASASAHWKENLVGKGQYFVGYL